MPSVLDTRSSRKPSLPNYAPHCSRNLLPHIAKRKWAMQVIETLLAGTHVSGAGQQLFPVTGSGLPAVNLMTQRSRRAPCRDDSGSMAPQGRWCGLCGQTW